MENEPMHKELVLDLRRAREKRISEQQKMFARGVPRGGLSVEVSAEWKHAKETEEALAGRLSALRYEAREKLKKIFEASAKGERVDQREVSRLNTLIEEIDEDVTAIL